MRHIDLHRKHFPHTLLCISDDVAGHERLGGPSPHGLTLDRGVTLRDDSILVQPPPHSWYHAEMAQEFWPTLPVILEHEHYGASSRRPGDGSLLLKAVEDYHASYMSIHWWPREFMEANRAMIDRINRRLGYRIQLKELSWPSSIVVGEPFSVQSRWANSGVAPCYPGGSPAVTLKDNNGGIVAVLVDEAFDVRKLQPGEPERGVEETRACTFSVGRFAPMTRPGTYDVFVSVGQSDGTPRIALPLAGDDGHRRYKLGSITVTMAGKVRQN